MRFLKAIPKPSLAFLLAFLLAASTVFSLNAQETKSYYWNTIHKFKKQDSVQRPPKNAILLVGSSSFTNWHFAQEMFPDRPVELELGQEIDDQLVVRSGLQAGQQVVASAQFLIDSEASLRGLQPTPNAATSSHSTKGVVEALDGVELTVNHEPVPALKWPAMTMGFKLAEPALAKGLKTGQRLRFSFMQRGDDYVITAIEPTGPGSPADTHAGHTAASGASR